jgi:hypothetical protein
MSKRDGDCVLHHGQFMIPAVTHGKFMIQATCVPPMIRNRCNKVFSACDTSMLRRMIGKQMSLCLFQKKQMSLCVEHWCTHMMLLCFFFARIPPRTRKQSANQSCKILSFGRGLRGSTPRMKLVLRLIAHLHRDKIHTR